MLQTLILILVATLSPIGGRQAAPTTLSPATPDLSGRWVLVPISARSDDAGFAPLGREFTVVQGPSTLTVTTTAQFGNSHTTLTYDLTGSERQQATTIGREVRTTVSTAQWKGNALIIITTWSLHRRTVTLSIDKDRLVVSSETSLLSKKNGQLVVSTIGPFVRAYERAPGH